MSANIYDWSTTAANNSNADGDLTWAEGQAPSTVNNSARVMMQRVKQLLVDLGGSIAAGGTANGLTVTASSAFVALADGLIVSFRATASNSAAATLNVNGIGAKAIQKMASTGDTALAANDIVNTGIYVVQYQSALNGAAGAWLLLNPTPGTAAAIKPPTFQVFSGSGTWTKPTGCTRAVFEAVGGGGGSGGVDGQVGATGGATGGGGSGFYGKTGFLDVSAVVSAAVTIGAGGTAGAAAAGNGGNGGPTSITIGATTYTWGGGNASSGRVASSAQGGSMGGGGGGTGTNVVGGGWPGGIAVLDAADANYTAGNGGSNPLGTGGAGAHNITVGSGSAAVDGVGFGAGGGGGIINQSTANQAGAAGSGGYMRVWEYYS